jgi:hypothetical protein
VHSEVASIAGEAKSGHLVLLAPGTAVSHPMSSIVFSSLSSPFA